ncbi:hypothetical protein BKA80DRAFT_318495 [Phyllosticta citrichinensis]
MPNHRKKVAIAKDEIQEIGAHNIMDDDLMPRAAATGWRMRKRPLINGPDTRPQRIDEWTPEFLFALQKLLRECEPAEKVKSLLRRQAGDKRKTRGDTPAEHENDATHQPPTKEARAATPEKSSDVLGRQNATVSQHKDKLWDMLFQDLDRLREIELVMEHMEERIENEPTKRHGHTVSMKRLAETLDEMDSKRPDDFSCASLEVSV